MREDLAELLARGGEIAFEELQLGEEDAVVLDGARIGGAEDELTLRQVLIIGLAQCIALIPGVSRSGATISTGLLLDIDRVTATRLSFFLAIPALTAAGAYELKDVDTAVVGWGQIAVGTAVSFVVAYASIAWLLQFVAKHPITVFVGYRVLLGAALVVSLAAGWISAT